MFNRSKWISGHFRDSIVRHFSGHKQPRGGQELPARRFDNQKAFLDLLRTHCDNSVL